MLVISTSSMSRLRSAQLTEYKSQLVLYFRETFPDQTKHLDERSLRDIVDRHVEGGLQRGIETSEAMSRYVGIAVLVNPDFAEHEDVVELFNFSGFDPDYKVHLLSDRLIRQLTSE